MEIYVIIGIVLWIIWQNNKELKERQRQVQERLERHDQFLEAYASVISLLGQTWGSTHGFRVEICFDGQLFGRHAKFVGLGADPGEARASLTLVNLADPRELLSGFLVREVQEPPDSEALPRYRFYVSATDLVGSTVSTGPGRLQNGVLTLTGDWRLLSQFIVSLHDSVPFRRLTTEPTSAGEEVKR